MNGKTLLWGLAGCLFVWRLVHTAMLAFSQPWTGASEQWEFGLFALCALAIALTLAIVVQRHGLSELRRRLSTAPALYRASGERPGKTRFRSLLVWIIVALVLVVVFQLQQHG